MGRSRGGGARTEGLGLDVGREEHVAAEHDLERGGGEGGEGGKRDSEGERGGFGGKGAREEGEERGVVGEGMSAFARPSARARARNGVGEGGRG